MMYPTLFLRPKGISMKRSQITQALDTLPDRALLGAAHKELTPKQIKFAREIAKGAKGAEAYRRSYSVTTKNKKAHGDRASRLKRDDRIQAEIEAYKAALEAQEYRTPAALRALIVQTLTQTILDPDVAPAVRVQAVRVLGTITEVSAFTHRTETTVIKRSDDAKAQLLSQLQDMMRTVNAEGTTDAEALLAELERPHRGGEAPDAVVTHRGSTHSNPHTESPISVDPPPVDTEPPPSVLGEK